ncbi:MULTISPECIES: cytochrome-c peroxidase [Arcobacteraceae]|uniref:Cytochrome c domain-containing protein n=1 Tax=Poseidonibacter parvus TaxID=1850254 RepID=A0A1P8KLR7_9BACT|nr:MULTISPECIES: cytochrome c peroxidase [Arcobacteraceae]APW65472.1 hypothetical protein LPB137_06235 [Poseidonibacter parvus]
MKIFMRILLFAFVVISILLSLPSLLKQRDFPSYNDDSLRKTAIKKGLKSIPKSYEEYLEKYEQNTILNKEKIALGKELFFNPNLSLNKKTSCTTCHMISKEENSITKEEQVLIDTNNCVRCHLKDESGTDRFSSSLGDNNTLNPHHLNTITILNSSLAKTFTWSGEVKILKEQIINSIKSTHKLNISAEELEKRFDYNYEEIIDAIEAYIKTLLTRSSFDEFLEGDNNAINKQAKQGLVNFMNFGCSGCHTGRSVGGQSVQRFPLRNFAGIHDLRPNLGPAPDFEIIDNTFPFENKGEYKGRANTSFFRVPILRNVTKTSPYFHNGSVDKIRKAVEIMGRHQVGINLTNTQIDDIVAFLKTLEGNVIKQSKKEIK